MVKKPIFIEYIILFFGSVFYFLTNYFSLSSLDGLYFLSSSEKSVNFLSFYFFSFFKILSFFNGLWVVATFLTTTIIYTFNKKFFEGRWQQFRPLFLAAIFLPINYWFAPQLLGESYIYLLQNSWPGVILFFFGVIGSFYESFELESIKAIWGKIQKLKMPKINFQRKISEINFREMAENFKHKLSLFCQKLFHQKRAAVEVLVDINKTHPVQEALQSESIAIEHEKEESDVPEEADMAIVENADESDDEIDEDDFVSDEKTALKKTTKNSSFHASTELIECLKTDNKKYQVVHPDDLYFKDITERLEEKLSEFKIDCQIINVLKGPVVDTFELELGAGVKVSKVTSITEDLGLALSGAPIRMVYPMKGKTTVGIEVPRNPREIILLDEILKSPIYLNTRARLPIAMGKDAFGDVSVVDLASMPHMLVAGATGAGKSVFINTLLVSLLVKMHPDKLKFILIDPKQLELALYGNLPHLILPVITEPKMASASLLWACQEMERRYSILKEFAVRNIDGFNEKLKIADTELTSKIAKFYDDTVNGYELPYLVIIVDEFADLILSKLGKDIENNICRLAAKARAAGIHLVIATQRPSVDVITGLIKSNFPTRVSFRVTSSIDSRTILNTVGSEKLLGMGDMLYKHGIEMARLHSAFVDEKEIEVLMKKLANFTPQFSEQAMEFIEEVSLEGGGERGQTSWGGEDSASEGKDELFKEAVKIAVEQRLVSASLLQRRLKIGYNRAANLVEEMEVRGIVGPQQGAKPRKVLVSSSDQSSVL